jgi:hypothetical protein
MALMELRTRRGRGDGDKLTCSSTPLWALWGARCGGVWKRGRGLANDPAIGYYLVEKGKYFL